MQVREKHMNKDNNNQAKREENNSNIKKSGFLQNL